MFRARQMEIWVDGGEKVGSGLRAARRLFRLYHHFIS